MATNSMAISHGAEATSFWQGVVVVLGRFFYGPQSLFQANNRHCGFSRRAFGFDRGSAFWCAGLGRRPEHFAGLSRKTWRLAHCALPGSGNPHDAQVLGGAGSDDGADAYGYVHEKCGHARQRLADFSVRCRTVQPGCPPVALSASKRRQPK